MAVSRINKNVLMIAALCAIAATATVLLRPLASVRLEGELAMLEPEEGLRRLNAASDKLDFEANLSFLHARLAMDAGELAVARKAYNRLTTAEEPLPAAWEGLAEVARLQNDLPQAIVFLSTAYRMEPLDSRRRKLSLWYRLVRDPQNEQKVLQSVPAPMLSAWEAERLAQLLRQNRRFDALGAFYAEMAESGLPVAEGYRRRLLDLRLEEGEAGAAMTLALGWYDAGDHDPAVLAYAVPALIDRGALGEAIAVAAHALSVAPGTAHVVIPLFAAAGHRAVAFDLQSRWLAGQTALSEGGWNTLIGIAETSGDMRGLRAALARVPRRQIPDATLDQVLRQFLRYQGVRALLPYRLYLTERFLRSAPLIGGAWMVGDGRPEEAIRYLAIAAAQPMAPRDQEVWMAAATSLRGGRAMPDLFAVLPPDNAMAQQLSRAVIGREVQLPDRQRAGKVD